jgi:hypothetical protein
MTENNRRAAIGRTLLASFTADLHNDMGSLEDNAVDAIASILHAVAAAAPDSHGAVWAARHVVELALSHVEAEIGE